MLQRGLLVAVLASALAGCMTTSAYQTASVVPEGKVRGFVAVERENATGTPSPYPGSTSSASLPQLEAGVRIGMGGGWDVGLKAWLAIGGQLEVKKELVDIGPHVLSLEVTAGAFAGSVGNPEQGRDRATPATTYVWSLPLLYGYRFGGNELVIGPRLTAIFIPSSGTNESGGTSLSGNALYTGGSLGVAIRLSESLRLMPELSFGSTVRLAGTMPALPTSDDATYPPIGRLGFAEIGIGLLFGG
jgi:hypothetical protein